jgi:glycyl-tRNA synthetase beta chain
MPHFLFEIGFEEMPARFLSGLASELQALFSERLAQARIGFGGIRPFVTARRLGLRVTDMEPVTRREEEVVSGPPEKVAFGPDGAPTKAALGFARTQGVDMDAAFVLTTDKGRYLAVRKTTGGEPTAAHLPDICAQCVRRLSFPKKMRWGSGDFAFGRPIHWFVALLDDAVIPFEVAGIISGRTTRGHRIMGPGPFEVPHADAYAAIIREKGRVIVDPAEREAVIRDQAEALAAKAGGRAVVKASLLAEVTGLTEYPVVALGRFDEKFLAVPKEVLLTSMESHQKSFGVEGPDGNLLPCFLTTLGLDPGESLDLVRKGWERVLRARLEDARFFWEADLAAAQDAWLDRLDNVVFLAGLGSMGGKSRRLEALCGRLAGQADAALAADAARAGRLCKADLVSEMVGEFAELQGVMGGIYARAKGESETVAAAVAEQYLPAGPDSPVPATLCGALLAVADKIDTLAGCFGMELVPTGAADPYALRRQALGICRIVIEHGLRLNLPELVQAAFEGYRDVSLKTTPTHALARLLDFFGQRLRAYFTGLGRDTLVVEAALGAGFEDIFALSARIEALTAFAARPDFGQAVLTFKRAANIIRKQGAEAGHPLTGHVDPALLAEEAEKSLHAKFAEAFPRLDDLLAADDFPALFDMLHELRPFVDAFFDSVMVMCEDPAVRANRLNLLMSLVSRLSRLADFAALQV